MIKRSTARTKCIMNKLIEIHQKIFKHNIVSSKDVVSTRITALGTIVSISLDSDPRQILLCAASSLEEIGKYSAAKSIRSMAYTIKGENYDGVQFHLSRV